MAKRLPVNDAQAVAKVRSSNVSGALSAPVPMSCAQPEADPCNAWTLLLPRALSALCQRKLKTHFLSLYPGKRCELVAVTVCTFSQPVSLSYGLVPSRRHRPKRPSPAPPPTNPDLVPTAQVRFSALLVRALRAAPCLLHTAWDQLVLTRTFSCPPEGAGPQEAPVAKKCWLSSSCAPCSPLLSKKVTAWS